MRLPRIVEIGEGTEGWGFFLCTRKEVRPTRSGAPLVSIALQDVSGEIAGKIFDQPGGHDEFEAGEFVKVQGRGNRHHQRLELVVESIRRVHPPQDRLEGFREEDCIPCAPRPIEEMWSELRGRLDRVVDPWLSRLLTDVVRAREEQLRIWPAAVTVHHAYRGGLLEHILALASLGDACATLYGLDRDVLFAGALLHDIGKLDELACGAGTTYTREGNLLGHIALGLMLVREAAGRIDGFPLELRARVEHMIVSHHGARELGSPVEPMTEEAFVLSAIDDLDARLHQVRRHLQSAEEGEFTPYHPRLKRVLFRPGGR
jgi:3'-5' exoribonuclease